MTCVWYHSIPLSSIYFTGLAHFSISASFCTNFDCSLQLKETVHFINSLINKPAFSMLPFTPEVQLEPTLTLNWLSKDLYYFPLVDTQRKKWKTFLCAVRHKRIPKHLCFINETLAKLTPQWWPRFPGICLSFLFPVTSFPALFLDSGLKLNQMLCFL